MFKPLYMLKQNSDTWVAMTKSKSTSFSISSRLAFRTSLSTRY